MRRATERDDPVLALIRGSSRAGDAQPLARRLIERAAREGLLDVAYASLETPVGRLILAATPRGLVRLALPNQTAEEVLAELARDVSPRVLELPARLDRERRALDRYFEGRLKRFELTLDWRLSAGFRRRVLRATAQIPYGRTTTYGEMASRAGSPRAQRAAGSALASNPIPIVVPCHRVLRAGGEIGGYGGGPELKRALLRLEGFLD